MTRFGGLDLQDAPTNLLVLRPIEIYGALPEDVLSLRPGVHLTLARELPEDLRTLLLELDRGNVTPVSADHAAVRAWLTRQGASSPPSPQRPSRRLQLLT